MKFILSSTILAFASFTAMANTNTPAVANHKAHVTAHVQTASLPFPICNPNQGGPACGGNDVKAPGIKTEPFTHAKEMASLPFPIPSGGEAPNWPSWWPWWAR